MRNGLWRICATLALAALALTAADRAAGAEKSGSGEVPAADSTTFTPPPKPPEADIIPKAPMGVPRERESLIDGHPLSAKERDPEIESVYRGRRLVEPMEDYELEGWYYDSVDDVARAVLEAIEEDTETALRRLVVTKEEFDILFWPEFPTSRPFTNITSNDAWLIHKGNTLDGIVELRTAYGGKELLFGWAQVVTGLAEYTNFNLYKGIEIHAFTRTGEEIVIDQVKTIAERNGRWKVYMYKD
ncbi:MAG: hypothetical protein JW958_12230 [Candidatus Eisenbacteria bacterium]|nr:hypothetical protein [Candidatus Eisenbacteria bacterium]